MESLAAITLAALFTTGRQLNSKKRLAKHDFIKGFAILEGQGGTTAVLGYGVDVVYSKEVLELADQIARAG